MKLGVFKAVWTTFFFGLRHFPAFYLLCLLVNLPVLLYIALSGKNELWQVMAVEGWENDLLTGTQIVLGTIATAVMVWTLIHDRQDESWTVLPALRDAFERMPMVLGVGITIAIGTTLLSVVTDVLREVAPLAAIAPLLIVSILSLIFALAMPCAAFDGDGVIDCFGRSAQLTLGSRWRIFATYFLVSVVLGIVMCAAALLVITVVQQAPDREDLKRLPAFWIFLGSPALNLFFLTATVAMHEQLAELEDGLEFGETAAVFD